MSMYVYFSCFHVTMPTDHTALFKARAKLFEAQSEKDDENAPLIDRSTRPLPTNSYRQYSAQITNLLKDMREFFVVVMSRRIDYLSFNSPFSSLSDDERDKFDDESEKVLRQLSGLIVSISSHISKDETLKKKNEKEHLTHAIAITQQHMNAIGKVVTDMRKLRIRQVANRQKYGRLSSLIKNVKERKDLDGMELRNRKQEEQLSPEPLEVKEEENGWDEWEDEGESEEMEETQTVRQMRYKEEEDTVEERYQSINRVMEEETKTEEEGPNLTEGERKQLMVENEKMYEKCAQVHQEIDHLETQINEIQRLQETFAEKLIDQERDIELVHDTAVHTTENLRDGNEWIRDAISNSASRRVVVLFCIIVITFTLLFLDWYNP